MPFLDGSTPETTPQITGIDPQAYVPPELNLPAPSIGEVGSAFMNYENTVGSVARHLGENWSLYYAQQSGWAPIDEDYDPFTDGDVQSIVQDRPELAGAFSQSSSRFESGLIRRRIANEDDARETMASAGAGGMATMLAMGIIDPVNLLPVGSGFRALQAGRMVRGALEGSAAGFASGVVSEAVLQGTQTTRTQEEGFANVAASTILSGALGGGLALVSPSARGPMADALAAEVRAARAAENDISGEGLQGGGGSGGAAAARSTTLGDQTRVSTGVGAERAGELPIVGNPMGRLSASPSVDVRRMARELTETAYHYQGEAKGVPGIVGGAVETRAKLWDRSLGPALARIDELFAQHRGFSPDAFAAKTRAGVQDIAGQRSPNQLSREMFMQRVTYAARRGDTDPIPEVDKAAKIFREVDDAMKKAGVEVGFFTEDVHVTTAESHVHRLYNREQIKAERPAFEQVIFDHISGLKQKGAEMVAQVNAWAKIRDRSKANIDKVEAEIKRDAELDVAGLRAKGAEARKQGSALRREVAVREKRVETLQRRLATAQRRQVKVTDRLPDTDPLVRDLENARTAKEPPRLIERVRDLGGLRDTDGLLKARGFKPIKKRNGKPIKGKDWHLEIIDPDARPIDARGLDQVANEMAAEEGFLPRRVGDDGRLEEPAIDDLVDALEADAFGEPVYAEFGANADEVTRWRDALNLKAELKNQDIELSWANERIASELGLIEDYVPNTPGARTKQREAGFYERRVADDLKNEQKALDDALKGAIKAEADAADKLGIARRMRGRREALARERSASVRAFEKFSKMVDAHQEIEVMSDADLRDIARQVTDKVLGYEQAGAIEVDGSANLRGAVLERSLTIPDFRIERWLENDAEKVLRKQVRQMGADIELARTFGRADMRDQFEEIRQHYAKVRQGVTDEKALAALDKRMASDIADLAEIRDTIRGTYGVPKDPDAMLARGFRVARGANYLRLMGGATLASLADPGAVVMTHGMSRVFGKPGMKAFVEALKGMRGRKGVKDEVLWADTASDLILDTRARTLAEIGDDWGQHSKFERGLQWAQGKFGLVNMLSIWTSFWKQFDGVIAQTRILEAAERWKAGTATAKEQEYLAYLGIDFDMATRLDLEQQVHGTKETGYRTANTARWRDREAAQAIRAALTKDVDTTIVTPGAGDKPTWMKSEWGKTLGQFKSFSMSAMARTTARGLQQKDVATLQGMTMMVTLGMLQYYIRTRDEDIDWDNPATWLKEGVDRSGVTGWLFEALNTQEKVLGGLGINSAIGSPSARYASRNATGAVLGPTFGLGEDALKLMQTIGKGEWSAADTHRIRKTLPAQNLWYLRWMFDQVEEGVNETLDIPDNRQKFKKRNDY